MHKIYQQTLLNPITFTGIGLHSGKNSKITVFPGNDNQGIVLGSTVEHPATRSACSRWSKLSDKKHILIPHNDKKGLV